MFAVVLNIYLKSAGILRFPVGPFRQFQQKFIRPVRHFHLTKPAFQKNKCTAAAGRPGRKHCGCGHDHEHHHHEHGESCGCGHNHGHGGNQVMIGRMSGHLLGTMTAFTPCALPVAEVNMNLSMKDVAMFIKENGGVPMQMKASLKDSSTTVIMNMLGKDIYRSESAESTETDPSRVKCNLLAVADGIDAEVLRQKLEEIMGYFVNNSF